MAMGYFGLPATIHGREPAPSDSTAWHSLLANGGDELTLERRQDLSVALELSPRPVSVRPDAAVANSARPLSLGWLPPDWEKPPVWASHRPDNRLLPKTRCVHRIPCPGDSYCPRTAEGSQDLPDASESLGIPRVSPECPRPP